MNKIDGKLEELFISCEPFSIKMIEEPALVEVKNRSRSIFLPTNREYLSLPANKKARLVRKYIHVKMVMIYNYFEVRILINRSLEKANGEWQ